MTLKHRVMPDLSVGARATNAHAFFDVRASLPCPPSF
jgi:hypothetical protein